MKKVIVLITVYLLIASLAYGAPEIDITMVNFSHVKVDPKMDTVEVWRIIAETHLRDDGGGFDPLATSVSISWPPSNTAPLSYYPIHDISGVHSYWNTLGVIDPSDVSVWETDYTFQVQGGPSEVHSIPSGTFIKMDTAVTTWDPSTGLLSWGSIANADFYNLWFYEHDEVTNSLYPTNLINLGDQLFYNIDLAGKPYQILSVQALDVDGQLGIINQSEYITYVTAAPIPIFSCAGFEPPCDSTDVALTAKKNKCIPLKTELTDEDGFPVTDTDIEFPPVLTLISFSGAPKPLGVETIEGLPPSRGTDGNQFEFIGGRWCFNLKVKDHYSAPGMYSFKMMTGNQDEYIIEPSCTVTILVEK